MPGNSVHIRPLRLREVGALRDLFLQALMGDFTYFPAEQIAHVRRQNTALRFVRAWLSRRRVVLVAVQHGELVGFAISATHADGIGHLYWLYVKPTLRHHKIGKQLLDASLEAMRSRGMTAVELVTYNIDRYYAKHGFWRRGKINQHGTDLHVMQFDFPENQVHRPRNVSRWIIRWPFWVGLIAAAGGLFIAERAFPQVSYQVPKLVLPSPKPSAGSIVQITGRQHYTAAQVTSLARQNYGTGLPASPHGATRIQLRYLTTAPHGSLITDYATAYIPDDVKTVNRANNSGIPVVLESPSAKVSKSMVALAASVNGRHA